MSDRASEKTTGKRTLAGVGALLAVGVSAAVLSACGVEKPTGGRPPSIVLEDVRLRHYAADGTVRVGTADEVTYHRREGRLEGEGIEVRSPPTAAHGRGGAVVRAGRGQADLRGRAAHLTEGVTVETGAGDRARTEAADWDAATETLAGDEKVQAEGPGYRANADGFAFRVPDQHLELRGDVRIHTEPGEGAR